MACKTSYDLHHNFPKLAEETGFAFNNHRPRIHIDWNKIRLIDIDSLTRDRKFALIEQHVNDILDCVLESEFDVRILDEGVVKLFRLAQLAVEYQQFCRHYLDRSVFVLRQEIDSLAQELANAKKDLQEKEEDLRKLRRKGKPHYKSLLPYGSDNIAAMILKTLTNKADIFAPTTNGEVPQYNKCNYCDKVFLNQLYLKSHISRRHANHLEEPPQRGFQETEPIQVNKISNENDKLNDEINQLKLKIKEMEILITNNNKVLIDSETIKSMDSKGNRQKEVRDVDVYTNTDDVFQKLEEWKKAEQANHTKEINLLRNQIFEKLNSFKVKDIKNADESDSKIVEQLYTTIKDQGAEIAALKQALTQSKLRSDSEDKERKKETEEQMVYWVKRDEAQSKKYEILVQKLNEVAEEARESRALADAERQRAGQLEALLKQRLYNKQPDSDGGSESITQGESNGTEPVEELKKPKLDKVPKPVVDHNSLEHLHRKAQELLNLDSSTTSDASSPKRFYSHQPVKSNKLINDKTGQNSAIKRRIKKYSLQPDEETPTKILNKEINKVKGITVNKVKKTILQKQKNIKKDSSKIHKNEQPKPSLSVVTMQQNGPILPPGSPLKVVRAKITEEVNNRLVQAGVDPLTSRLKQNVFQKQKAQLQHQLDIKSKKNPAYEQVRYTIMAYLDSDASSTKRDVALEKSMTMATPNALAKALSLSSMISNVKSKALSLVKHKELINRNDDKVSNPEFAKKDIGMESPVITNLRQSRPTTPDQDGKSDSRREYETLEDKNVMTRLVKRKTKFPTQRGLESDTDESPPDTFTSVPQRPARSIDNLIMSPVRRPLSASADYSNTGLKHSSSRSHDDHLLRTQSVTNILEFATDDKDVCDDEKEQSTPNDNIQALLGINKVPKTDNCGRPSPKQAKGVLKNASSTSSLNKKKVIFDMDAIQMKSVSASPSQSFTEKSDDKYELGLINIGDDEWDISSIDNEPAKNDTKIRANSAQSSKIAELKQTIEAQLARRSETPSTALFGGVDVLRGPVTKSSNVGGSNTSLGSSIFDDSDSAKFVSHKPVSLVKPKNNAEKEDSELDFSDYSVDGVTNKNKKDSF